MNEQTLTNGDQLHHLAAIRNLSEEPLNTEIEWEMLDRFERTFS